MARTSGLNMGAIFGVINRQKFEPMHSYAEKLKGLANRLGPDDSGVWHEQGVCLGQSLLTTQRQSVQKRQPLEDCAGRLVIVVDSQLLDKKNLASTLGLQNANKISDSELILEAYNRWGKNCPEYLVGEFAFAIWDRLTRELFCARDHTGARNLCYFVSANKFIFASEIKSILSCSGVSSTLSDRYLCQYLNAIPASPSDTAFTNIHRLPPATAIHMTSSKISTWNYWNLHNCANLDHCSSGDNIPLQADSLLSEILADRIDNSDQIALMCGGGLNTALLASYAAPIISPDNIIAVSYALAEDKDKRYKGEREYSSALFQHLNLPIEYVNESSWGNPFNERLTKRFYDLDDPAANPIGTDYDAIFSVFQRRNIKQVWLGTDNDSLLSWSAHGAMPELIASGNVRPLARLFLTLNQSKQHSLRAVCKQTISKANVKLLHKYTIRKTENRLRQSWLKKSILNTEMEGLHKLFNEELEKSYENSSLNSVQTRVRNLEKSISHQHRKMALENAYQLRYSLPFLDKRLIEFCLSVPVNEYIGKQLRHLARTMLINKAPKKVVNRDTRSSFPIDYSLRLENAKAYLINEIDLISTQSAIWQYADRTKVREQNYFLRQSNNVAEAYNSHNLRGLIRVLVLDRYLKWMDTTPYN